MTIGDIGNPFGLPPASSQPAAGGAPIIEPGASVGGGPISGPESTFNRAGAPIAVLGGVFSGGLPLGGPLTQIFRGGSAPIPPTLFVSTISPGGPIGTFIIGGGGGPIGVDVFGGGGLPISAPPAVQEAEAEIQPQTALVALPSSETIFEGGVTAGAGAPITGGAELGAGAPSNIGDEFT